MGMAIQSAFYRQMNLDFRQGEVKAQRTGCGEQRSLSLVVQCQATSNLKSFPISSPINISGYDDYPANFLST